MVSIQKGPNETDPPQLPASSIARTCSRQPLPSGEAVPVKLWPAWVTAHAGTVPAAVSKTTA